MADPDREYVRSLERENRELRDILKEHELWLDELVFSSEPWGSAAANPTIPRPLWDRLLKLDGKRDAALFRKEIAR